MFCSSPFPSILRPTCKLLFFALLWLPVFPSASAFAAEPEALSDQAADSPSPSADSTTSPNDDDLSVESSAPSQGHLDAADAENADAENTPPATPLEEWKALTANGATSYPVARYGEFLRQKRDWPLQGRIQWRFEHALGQETAPGLLQTYCPLVPLRQLNAFLTCAASLPDASAQARRLWVEILSQPDEEALLLSHYGADFTPDDQWQRFERLEKQGAVAAAKRQIPRLDAAQQALAQARLAVRSGDDTLYQTLPPLQQNDEKLLLLLLRQQRRDGRTQDALQLWQANGLTVQTQVTPLARQQAWTAERSALMRALLREGDTAGARKLGNDVSLPPTDIKREENAFLTAYTALLLNQPDQATEALQPLSQVPRLSARAEALHWRAQAAALAGNTQQAKSLLTEAAQYPTTFYGQFSQACQTNAPYLTSSQREEQFQAQLGAQLQQLPPLKTQPHHRQDLIEAAETLTSEGDFPNAALFLSWLVMRAQNSGERVQAAQVAERLGNAQSAILAGRALAREGQVLYPTAYPTLYTPNSLPASFNLPKGLIDALIRQESSGDPLAASPAKAYGLMQMLPATAAQTARKHGLHLATSPVALQNKQTNLLLGSLFLEELYNRFDSNIPHLLSAYNAGPRRTRQWQDSAPQTVFQGALCPAGEMSLLGWIELLPANETRHYIEQIETDYSLYALPSH